MILPGNILNLLYPILKPVPLMRMFNNKDWVGMKAAIKKYDIKGPHLHHFIIIRHGKFKKQIKI